MGLFLLKGRLLNNLQLDLQGRTLKLRLQQPTKHAFFLTQQNKQKCRRCFLVRCGPMVIRFVQRSGSVYLYAFVAFGEFVAVLIGLCLDDMKEGKVYGGILHPASLKFNVEPENDPGKRDSVWKPSFSGEACRT